MAKKKIDDWEDKFTHFVIYYDHEDGTWNIDLTETEIRFPEGNQLLDGKVLKVTDGERAELMTDLTNRADVLVTRHGLTVEEN